MSTTRGCKIKSRTSVRGVAVGESVSLQLPKLGRGVHIITSHVNNAIAETLPLITVGTVVVFCPHTSAGLLLNESCDPSVRDDLETIANTLVPESDAYVHDDEGPDDMPAHAKSVVVSSSSVTIPVVDGAMALGTWQGIQFWEHRSYPRSRTLVVTLTGVMES